MSVALASALAACGGGGGGSAGSGGAGGGTGGGATPNGILLTGTVAGGSGLSGVDLRYGPRAGGSGSANEVWAIPIAKMQGANIDSANVMLRETKPLPANGKFEFDLPKSITVAEIEAKVPNVDLGDLPEDHAFDVDWLIVTVDTTSNPVRVVSQVRLAPDGGYGDLLALPTSGFKDEEKTLDLGTVGSDGEATTTTAVMETKTNLSSDSLKTLARADDILQALKDIIRNCDISENKCYEARQSFVFKGDYAALASGFDKATSYSGYQLYFDLNDYYDTSDFDAVCAGSLVYTLTPPGNVTVNGVTYNATTNPMTTGSMNATVESRNGGAQEICSKSGTFLSKNKDGSGNWRDWQLQYITGDSATELTTDMPAGDWVLKRDGTEIARFEFRAASPVDADDKPITFVPAIRLLNSSGNTVSAGEKIAKAVLKWYRWDSASADYVEITDLALLDDLASSFDFGMFDLDGKTGNTGQAYPRVDGKSFQNDTEIDVSSWDFYYDYSGNDHYNAQYIGVSYQFGGQGFRFSWRP